MASAAEIFNASGASGSGTGESGAGTNGSGGPALLSGAADSASVEAVREWWWRADSLRPDYVVPEWAHIMTIIVLVTVFISGAIANLQVLMLLNKHRDFLSPTNALIINMVRIHDKWG